MKLKITGGSLEAEIQGNPLDNIHKQLASISQSTEVDIEKLRTYIQNISEMKDDKINRLYDEFRERKRLEDMEIDEIRTLLEGISVQAKGANNTAEMEGLKDQLRSVALENKEVIRNILDKLDRVSRDKNEKIERLQRTIKEITAEDNKKITTLKEQVKDISIKGRYPEAQRPPKQGGTVDGTKYMGKLNYKPKLPI